MFGGISNVFDFQTAKEKKIGENGLGRIRPETGRIVGRIALGKIGFGHLLSGQYPARNPAGNPARFRPDSAVPGTIHVGYNFHFFYYFVILASPSALLFFRNVLERV